MNRRKFLGRGLGVPAFFAGWAALSFLPGSAKAASCTIGAVGGAKRRKPRKSSGALYRPKATVVSPSPKTIYETSNPVVQMVIDFHVTKGFVAKIHVRVNGKKVKTIPIEGEMAHGRVKISYDFSPWGPGLHKVKLEAVNGWPGHQSSRGRPLLPSLKVRLTP